MKLTLDQRAARTAKMRNNKTRKELPLLAATDAIPAEWLTTVDAQKERIQKITSHFEQWWAEFQEAEKTRVILAERYRAECHELASEEQFEELDKNARIFQGKNPVYLLDFWHRALARLDPKYCPHFKDGHAVSKALGHDQCPVCLVKGLLR